MMNIMVLMFGFMFIILIVLIMIGVYVYKDAKSRGMNAVLWTLVVVLAPIFIGFIIYLLARESYSNLKCPNCNGFVTEQFTTCPNCGERLKATCSECGLAIETNWKVCPGCAASLPQEQNYNAPIQKEDKFLGKILLAVILIPVLLIVFLIVVGFVAGYLNYL